MSDFGFFFWLFSIGAVAWFFFILPYFRRLEKKRIEDEKKMNEQFERLRILAQKAREQEQRARQQRATGSTFNTTSSIPSVVTESFKILGLSVTSKEDDIKKAYRSLTLKHHPDRGGNSEKFVQITKAKDNCLKYLNKTSVVAILILCSLFGCENVGEKKVATQPIIIKDTIDKPAPVDNTLYYYASDFGLPTGKVVGFSPTDEEIRNFQSRGGDLPDEPIYIHIKDSYGVVKVYDCTYKAWLTIYVGAVLK